MSTESERKAREISLAIITGEVDEHISFLYSQLNERREQIAREAKWALQVGDRVRFNSKGRTDRFTGQEGRVIRKLQKNIEVELADGRVVRSHPTLVDIINDEEVSA